MAFERQELSGTVHVTLHDVATEAAVGPHGEFKIDRRTFFDPREGSAIPGFVGQVGGERLRT